MSLNRRQTFDVLVGDIGIGSSHPICVQSMTNTDTEDVSSTVKQIVELHKAGSEIVRVTINTVTAGSKIKEIKNRLFDLGVNVPLVGDFHFNGHKILSECIDCAKHLDKYRINPGNVGRGLKKDSQFLTMIKYAIEYDKPIRIGVNWGSLDQELMARMLDENNKLSQPLDLNIVTQNALINSALESAYKAIEYGLPENKIILSCKVSQVQDLIAVYSSLATKCKFPLHVGLTEAGMGIKGIVSSATGIGCLLQMGIGDTIRVSLTPAPNESRTKEVAIAREILQSLGIRAFKPSVTACPGCGRTSSDYFLHLAKEIEEYLDAQMPLWKTKHPGVEDMKVAVMGCVVNGPGESKLANIGISLPGRDESPVAPVYVDGERFITLKGDAIIAEFKAIVTNYVETKYII